jgi:hypothetical protein
MKNIFLTGKESKLELQSLLENKGVKYSKLDTKEVLLLKLSSIEEEVQSSLQKNNTLSEGEVKDILPIQGINFISGDQYCNIKGYNSRVRYFIKKKYPQQKFTEEEWYKIFHKEKLI